LIGGGGADDLYGGTGPDDLTGGTGTDNFRFDAALNAATNVDDMLDFNVAEDTIQLDRDIFTGIAADGALAGAFRTGTSALDADDRIIYDAVTGQIFYDADGLGGTAQILFATVNAGTALTNADFVGYI
jgi:Ca2+-binding RTX toxin-like protein